MAKMKNVHTQGITKEARTAAHTGVFSSFGTKSVGVAAAPPLASSGGKKTSDSETNMAQIIRASIPQTYLKLNAVLYQTRSKIEIKNGLIDQMACAIPILSPA